MNQEAKGAQGPVQQLSTDRTEGSGHGAYEIVRLTTTQQGDEAEGSGHGAYEIVVAIHSSQHTVQEPNQIVQPAFAKAHESLVAIHTSHSD
ncbi:hypothetical protein F511_25123 [Dorcoceras hygrometricum]|uniref:Uncharacterized protein n=1 Tax=Dorcoceras hygrometricum TaxID=472368 RepID=A0A2Z7D950_9LAMI|nr:hypothetical protein F511_25123 [Dorcoceras hygrometricum]